MGILSCSHKARPSWWWWQVGYSAPLWACAVEALWSSIHVSWDCPACPDSRWGRKPRNWRPASLEKLSASRLLYTPKDCLNHKFPLKFRPMRKIRLKKCFSSYYFREVERVMGPRTVKNNREFTPENRIRTLERDVSTLTRDLHQPWQAGFHNLCGPMSTTHLSSLFFQKWIFIGVILSLLFHFR